MFVFKARDKYTIALEVIKDIFEIKKKIQIKKEKIRKAIEAKKENFARVADQFLK